MPYFVTEEGQMPDCAGYAVVKEDGEVVGCHTTKQDAIDQMIAVSLAEDLEPGGDYSQRDLPDNYRPALEDDVPEGRACGNCFFYDESMIRDDMAWCRRWEEYVRGDHYCNAWRSQDRAALSAGERKIMDNVEIRTFDAAICEMRASEDGDGMTFGGYAWRYMEPSLPLPFTERIAPGAFTRTLKSKNDIRAYVNHDDTRLLGSTRAKTLRIEDRAEGGWVEIDLPNTTDGNDIRELVARGDIQGMSFGFSTVRDSWSSDQTERTLEEVRLHEVSVVTSVPA